jgi:Tol biopolymer transport system component
MPMGKLRPYLATAVLVLLVSTAFAGSIRTPTIVWSSSRSGTLGIWAMNPDGTGQRQLTDDTGRDITPSISPDGRSIAFSSYRGGGLAELWVMNQDGSGLRRVASVPGLNVQWPTWSPDGGMLYFDAVAGASSGGLYSVRLDGTDLTRLLSGYAARPEVSPDGTEIWFDKRTSSDQPYAAWAAARTANAPTGHAERGAADVVEAEPVLWQNSMLDGSPPCSPQMPTFTEGCPSRAAALLDAHLTSWPTPVWSSDWNGSTGRIS